ncbi:MAG: segregation/condensation protein A [Ruminococcus sp.]|nr:segregation/condensation protein A [Ruminococcus sp.]
MENLQLNYKLPDFEGPLDLLLSLISKNKINIYDIVIADLLDQYMEQIKYMQDNQMDIAAEFLTMASRLVYIKSAMLLPKYEDEAEELKKELSGQLIEYQLCKEIAAKLSKIYDFDTFYKDASPVKFDLTYNRKHDPQDIVRGFIDAVGRGKRKLPPPQSAFAGIMERKIVSVNSRIITVMRKLWRGRRVKYAELFEAADGRGELVATFLAVLELVKGKRVRIDGSGSGAQVYMLEDRNNG